MSNTTEYTLIIPAGKTLQDLEGFNADGSPRFSNSECPDPATTSPRQPVSAKQWLDKEFPENGALLNHHAGRRWFTRDKVIHLLEIYRSAFLPVTPEPQVIRPPFQKELTLILTKNDDAQMADKDLAAIEDGCSTVLRIGHLENYFHQLRLRAQRDSGLLQKITVFYLDENNIFHPIGLEFKDELSWPPGFLNEAWDIETEIQKLRHPRIAKKLAEAASLPVQQAQPPRSREFNDAVRLANKILDRPSGDPDDDLAVLSRQFLRAIEPKPMTAAPSTPPASSQPPEGSSVDWAIRAAEKIYLLYRDSNYFRSMPKQPLIAGWAKIILDNAPTAPFVIQRLASSHNTTEGK